MKTVTLTLKETRALKSFIEFFVESAAREVIKVRDDRISKKELNILFEKLD